MCVALVALDELLTRSDFVSVHVPESDETAGMLGTERLALMPPGAFFVNVTSTAVVDQAALVAALLAGAYPAWAMGRSDPALAMREE